MSDLCFKFLPAEIKSGYMSGITCSVAFFRDIINPREFTVFTQTEGSLLRSIHQTNVYSLPLLDFYTEVL